MALGLAARAKRRYLNLFKDIRACGTDEEGPARRHATRHDQFVIWSSLFEQRWSISGGGHRGRRAQQNQETTGLSSLFKPTQQYPSNRSPVGQGPARNPGLNNGKESDEAGEQSNRGTQRSCGTGAGKGFAAIAKGRKPSRTTSSGSATGALGNTATLNRATGCPGISNLAHRSTSRLLRSAVDKTAGRLPNRCPH